LFDGGLLLVFPIVVGEQELTVAIANFQGRTELLSDSPNRRRF
jgi:hypothetical protein